MEYDALIDRDGGYICWLCRPTEAQVLVGGHGVRPTLCPIPYMIRRGRVGHQLFPIIVHIADTTKNICWEKRINWSEGY